MQNVGSYSIYADMKLSMEDMFQLKYRDPRAPFAYLKHVWDLGEREEAFEGLKQFVNILEEEGDTWSPLTRKSRLSGSAVVDDDMEDSSGDFTSSGNHLLARCYLKLGQWQRELLDWNSPNSNMDPAQVSMVIQSLRKAIQLESQWHKAWHWWALVNFDVVNQLENAKMAASGSAGDADGKEASNGVDGSSSGPSTCSNPLSSSTPVIRRSSNSEVKKKSKQEAAVLAAVHGFFQSIALGSGANLQDTLRLLTLWFKYTSNYPELETTLSEGFETISIDTWLQVIPQILARIHSPSFAVRRLILQLLSAVGKKHPQALVYPLTVAAKSQHKGRVSAARSVIKVMQHHSATLVEQAELVSVELIRVAILWLEMWHEGLEEASRLYFGERNVDGMFDTLAPLHRMLDVGPETTKEIAFHQGFARDLQEAREWCRKYSRSGKVNDLNQAWDLYYHVFRRINKQLPQIMTLELQHVSPKLLAARDLELAVPGTYVQGMPITKIQSFAPTLKVIASKQRPRKLSIYGSDGRQYAFLLKGHEDLRQDERVMQLFGLVNTLLAHHHRHAAQHHLNIHRYAVIPLSPNSGLIGWVPHTDTMHQLIREYRDQRKVPLNVEHRLMLQMSQDFDHLSLVQKVEVFQYALDSTNGLDLNRILWLKSRNSEAWLERRTNYTRSLAVMSMVGYVLGLGDRHPSNLMLHRVTGNVIHIDFGDCFEVAMHREKYPEKIPFRLTRMLTNAMEVSGIEGTFRETCEGVMGVLRQSKESLMAVLAAFVYDPLINWRLLTPMSPGNATQQRGGSSSQQQNDEGSSSYEGSSLSPYYPPSVETFGSMTSPSSYRQSHRSRMVLGLDSVGNEGVEGEMPEVLNQKALSVITRVSNKLTGRDFGEDEVLDVAQQVQRLIDSSTSHENLCQCYIGWCPFW